jgi:FkbM family methyltransferase
MIALIKKLIPNSIKRYIRNKLLSTVSKMFDTNTITYSQSGEDIILRNIFNFKENGFFIDVGAYNPIILSNTYYFYSIKNWSGINFDACPGSMDLFHQIRSSDINIEAAISDEESELTYYYIDKFSSMNSFSKEFLLNNNAYDKVTKEIPIKTERLETLLDKHLIINKKIDFMSVDVEGKDLSVLRSNNWEIYRPKIVIVETKNTCINEIHSTSIAKFMTSVGYEIISIVYQSDDEKNVIFRDINQKEF